VVLRVDAHVAVDDGSGFGVEEFAVGEGLREVGVEEGFLHAEGADFVGLWGEVIEEVDDFWEGHGAFACHVLVHAEGAAGVACRVSFKL